MRLRYILLALALPVVTMQGLRAQKSVIALDSLAVVHYTDGIRLAVEERYDEALRRFEKALETDPEHTPSLYEAANVRATLGDVNKALEFSSRAVELDPSNRWYTGQKARLLYLMKRDDEALPLFEALVEGDHFDPDNYGMLALIYFRKGRLDDALSTLDAVEVRMGKTAEVVEMRRGFLINNGRFEDALKITEDYVAATPFDEANRLVLVEMYDYQERDSLAVETLKEVLAINPDNADALDRLAGFYREKNEMGLFFSTMKQIFLLDEVPLEDKIARFDLLAQNTTLYRRYFMEMGDLALTLATRYSGRNEVIELYSGHLMRMGDVEGALNLLKTRLRGAQPPLSAFMQVMEIETWLERADSVAMYSDRALELYPDEHRIYMFRSSAEQYLGRMKDARKTLDRALRVATTDSLRSETYGATGTLWHEEGNDRKAFAEYDKALRYNPDNALVLNNYAYFLAVEGRELDRALGMASRAVKLRQNDATFLDTYAWVLYKTGDYAEAKKVMQQALPLDEGGGSAELLIHYGDILWALDEEFMASMYWKRARDAGYEPVAEIEERLSRIEITK